MSDSDQLRVYKFGGTSVLDADRIFKVVELVAPAVREGVSPIVVVSAFGGITDRLLELSELATAGDPAWEEALKEIEARHREALERLAGPDVREELDQRISRAVKELEKLGRGISLVGECSRRTGDRLLSFGERLSAPLVAAAFRTRGVDAEAVDAREIVVTDDHFGAARVLREETEARIRERLGGPGPVRIVTGFLGATVEGDITTLGRGGSDYTATLLGASLDVDRVEIWTDVDGIMSADPRIVPDAFSLESVTYDELLELSHLGAKVVAPLAVHPVREEKVPLLIRNTLNPSFAGTRVVAQPERDSSNPVRGISAIHDVVLLRLENVERVGLMETAERLFGALRRRGIDLLLYTQDSSGHNLSFAVRPEDLRPAREAARDEFDRERKAGLLGDLVAESHRSVVAVVGEGMRETPGVAAQLFDVLGAEGVNIHAIAQGSSERNISCVITAGDEGRTLRAVHAAFFRDPSVVRIFVVGTGRVGSTFLDHLAELGPDMVPRPGLRLELAGVGRSSVAAAATESMDPGKWEEALERSSGDPDLLFRAAKATPGPRILVDCTASEDVSDRYEELLEAGVTVVTANKLALSGSLERYQRLRRLATEGPGMWYRTTVGAGLPMIRSVSDLRLAGDRVQRIEGVLSGTLGYLFHAIREGRPFSEAVREAQEKGLAEPDPREDLKCADVARKLLILGREAGMDLEPEDVTVEPVVPAEYLEGDSADHFLASLEELDEWFVEKDRDARERGARLVPLGSVDEGRAEVGLREVPEEQPITRIRGTENLLSITSGRYGENPIVIQGSGAGRSVTAHQLLADVVHAGLYLVGARRPGRPVGARRFRSGGEGGSETAGSFVSGKPEEQSAVG